MTRPISPAYQRTLDLLVTLAEKSDAIYPSHYQVPMVAEDIVATRAALNEVIGGRAADQVMEGQRGLQVRSFRLLGFVRERFEELR